MASSRLFALLGPSIIIRSRIFSQVPSLHFNKIRVLPSLQFRCYSSSASGLDPSSSTLTIDSSSAHPWPEWVNFVDRLKSKGYLTQNHPLTENDADGEGLVVYTDMKLVKDACLNFARDRFDIFKSLSTQDVQRIVERGCPNILRKTVNSAKRLRAYLGLDEGDVCSSCKLRGSCDRAYVMVNDSEAAARTVDVVRILLFYALDPIVIYEETKPPGRELIESSARKLIEQLIELGETQPNPDLPKPASVTSQRKKKGLGLSLNESSKNHEMKQGDWVCIKCNFMNFARNMDCLKCNADRPKRVSIDEVEMRKGDWNCPQCNFMNFARNTECIKCLKCKSEGSKRVFADEVEMKKGDWNCPECNYMNFARNTECLKCKSEGPKSLPVDEVEMKKGDWNCPQCSFMNFSSKRQCHRCQMPRPPRQLKPGDWECPECDFSNFGRNNVCRRCNIDRPVEESAGTWKKPY